MAYTITRSNGLTFQIADGTLNTTQCSLSLPGRNYAGYGLPVDQDLVRMLENFSNVSPPQYGLQGQLWLDTSLAPISNTSVANANIPTLRLNIIDQNQSNTGNSYYWVPLVSSPFSQTLYLNGSPNSLVVGGTAVFNGPVTFGNGNSTSTTTGAITLPAPGGIGVGGNVSIGGDLIGGNGVLPSNTGSSTHNFIGNWIFPSGAGNSLTVANVNAGLNPSNLNGNWNIPAGNSLTLSNLAAGSNPAYLTGNWVLPANTTLTNGVTFINNGTGATGAAPGNLYNGNSNLTVSWNTVGAASGNAGGWANVGLGPIPVANLQVTGGALGNVMISDGAGGFTWGTPTAILGNALSFSSTGNGVTSPDSFTGAAVKTISYNTLGAAQASNPTNYYAVGISNAGNTTGMNPATGDIYGAWTLAAGSTLQATYADLAERFAADELYDAGTVVEIGGDREVTAVQDELSDRVFGVVSKSAAFMMNGGAGNDVTHPAIAVSGRVPVKVVGQVQKGDRLVSAGSGRARAAKSGEATAFNVIGRALTEKITREDGVVEAFVTIK